MRNFTDEIEEVYKKLTKKQRVVADYFQEHMANVVFKRLDQLAAEIGVSTTSVIGFTRAMGFNGYTDMQQALQETFLKHDTLPVRLQKTLDTNTQDSLLYKSMQNDIDNIYRTIDILSKEDLERAVGSIVNAKNLYVLSSRSAFAVAYFLGMRLSQIKNNVHLISGVGMTYPEGVVNATIGDVCIAVLIPRYERMVARLVAGLKQKGVRIILIAKQGAMEIAPYGDIILPCYTDSISYKSSFIALFAVCNYLLAAVAMKAPEEAMKNLTEIEEMLGDGYYLGLDRV